MKKNISITIIMSLFFVLSFMPSAFATGGPPDPSADPTTGGTPIGGGAPVGGGAFILMGLAAVYGSKKVYDLYKDNKEELED